PLAAFSRRSATSTPCLQRLSRTEGNLPSSLPLAGRCGRLTADFHRTDARVRPVLRLLPLPLCIALSLPLTAHADDDRPLDWSLCPVEDAVPAFADAPPPVGTPEDRESQNTDVAGDSVE